MSKRQKIEYTISRYGKFSDWPRDIKKNVAKELDARSLLTLGGTSRQMATFLFDKDVWLYFFDRDYDGRFNYFLTALIDGMRVLIDGSQVLEMFRTEYPSSFELLQEIFTESQLFRGYVVRQIYLFFTHYWLYLIKITRSGEFGEGFAFLIEQDPSIPRMMKIAPVIFWEKLTFDIRGTLLNYYPALEDQFSDNLTYTQFSNLDAEPVQALVSVLEQVPHILIFELLPTQSSSRVDELIFLPFTLMLLNTYPSLTIWTTRIFQSWYSLRRVSMKNSSLYTETRFILDHIYSNERAPFRNQNDPFYNLLEDVPDWAQTFKTLFTTLFLRILTPLRNEEGQIYLGNRCAVCDAKARSRCAHCNDKMYCGEECLKKDWPH